jgi:hypothetical protein
LSAACFERATDLHVTRRVGWLAFAVFDVCEDVMTQRRELGSFADVESLSCD